MKKIFMYFCLMSLVLVFLAIKFGPDQTAATQHNVNDKETSDDREMRELSNYIDQFQQIGTSLHSKPYNVLLASVK